MNKIKFLRKMLTLAIVKAEILFYRMQKKVHCRSQHIIIIVIVIDDHYTYNQLCIQFSNISIIS